ncbi:MULTISPECIES: YciI family protein [unclassified Crossiella]|uniref:YciI family protein n=1 Tax=unclassified Crossiella TaxID=2620835 RepID=UPI001FFE579D|nr:MULTISPECIES: YciI family protein [unclassified Crossiella]MCK2238883.1 YciI family protein [Crossiella sp. S99.2]MCK2251547.1 YciI family protein [Crossiella sp. S99.1]
MKYLMFVRVDDALVGTVEDNAEDWVDTTPQRLDGDRLRPTAEARTVRSRALVSDGPFAETKEWIAGFDLLDCASLDEAIAIAARHPVARFGAIELRQVG